ncbi:MAG: hypothetical protein IIA30_12855 [Myxococcales bacterium]|nr:hypothetical protein [Myxococcales bacterium]
MALQLSNGCDAYVSFEVPYGASLFLEYDWGYHTLGNAADDGDLEVRLVQLVRSSEPDTLNTLSTYTHSFQPRQAKPNTGPIYPESVGFNLASLGLQTETEERSAIIQVHVKGTSTGRNDWAWVDNVNITRESPLPRGTVSWTQGYFHHTGEVLTCEVLATMDSNPLAAMSVDAVSGITAILGSDSVGVDLAGVDVDVTTLESEDVYRLCVFLVGEVGRGFRYISEALDLERFTMFTYSPIDQKLGELVDFVRETTCDGEPLREQAHARAKIAQLVTQAEVARVMGLRFVHAARQVGDKPPTNEASQYKLFATGLSQRVANAMADLGGPGAQLRVHEEGAPMRGRADMAYRYSVIDTIGGGASEIQKNIIARRKLGLPKNF